MKNTYRQEPCWVNHPPSTGPTAAVMEVKPDQVPIARPRSSSEKLALISARLPGTSNAPPMFEQLQLEQIVRIKIEAFSIDSTSVKVHPDGTGALKKTDHRPLGNPEADGTPRFIWLPRMLERQ